MNCTILFIFTMQFCNYSFKQDTHVITKHIIKMFFIKMYVYYIKNKLFNTKITFAVF